MRARTRGMSRRASSLSWTLSNSGQCVIFPDCAALIRPTGCTQMERSEIRGGLSIVPQVTLRSTRATALAPCGKFLVDIPPAIEQTDNFRRVVDDAIENDMRRGGQRP